MRSLPSRGLDRLLGRVPAVGAARELVDALVEHIAVRSSHLDDGEDDALAYILRHARAAGRPLSPAEALDEALTLLLAGHETTATILAWALYHLGRLEPVRLRLRAEVDAACPDGTFQARALERLPYLRAVIDETLRLDGITPAIARRLRRDMIFEGYHLPAGTIVMGYNQPFHRDPAQFPAPDTFEPEHMLGKRFRPWELTPFGGGHRRCAGASFAEYELALLIGRLVQRVSFRLPAGVTVGAGQFGPLRAPERSIPLEVVEVRPARRD